MTQVLPQPATMLGDWFALGGDILVLVGLGLTYVVYRRQKFDSIMGRIDSTLALLSAVRDGMAPWGDKYFGGGYDDQAASTRARQDYASVLGHGYGQVFRVPTEPLFELVQGASGGGPLISRETIEAANVALWQIGIFNQLVQQQSDFNAFHQAEISDDGLDDTRRVSLAKAAEKVSLNIHMHGIGDAEWYANLKAAIDGNIHRLQTEKRKTWWHRNALRTEST